MKSNGATNIFDGEQYNGKIQIFADKIKTEAGEVFKASIVIGGKNNSYWLNNEQKNEKYTFDNEPR